MIIQNNNLFTTANTTQGTSTVTATTGSSFVADFSYNNPSVHEVVTAVPTDRIMIFRTAGVSHTFTVPAGGLNCDILMIGGGGGGGGYGNGGGAGACIVTINQTLPAGSCVVFVGNGGVWNGGIGGDSYITVEGADRYRAKGGGGAAPYSTNGYNGGCGGGCGYYYGTPSGGQPVGTNVVTLNDGSTGTTPPTINNTHRFAVMGKAGSGLTISNTEVYTPGGGIGTAGSQGVPGNGKFDVSINGTTYNFRDHFANGGNSFGVLHTDNNYYIGGGGNYVNPSGIGGGGASGQGAVGVPNTGSGGGSSGVAQISGGSGIIIIRYRSGSTTTTYTHTTALTTTLSTPTLGTPSIELVRGTQGDSNTDYKIGNYNGDFIVKSSANGVDTDYIRIVGTSASIFNSTASPQWSTVSDRRIKENIEKASYDKCYDTINKLELYRFNYIKELNSINKDKTQLGYIAQEVNDVFPKAVSSYEFNNTMLSIPDLLSIDIAQINYSLYGAVKKLIEINNNKEVRLKKLESILNIECNSSNVAIVEDTYVSSNVAIVEDVMSSNVVIVDDVMSSNVAIVEDAYVSSNVAIVEDVMSSNVAINNSNV